MDCRVIGDGWEHEIGIAGPASRVIGVGSCRRVRIVVALAEDGTPVEDRTFDLPGECLAMYTIGGRTAYRWTTTTTDAPVSSPPLPRGWLATFPPGATVRLSADASSDQRLLTLEQWHGADVCLVPLAVPALTMAAAKPTAPLSVRGDFQVAQIPTRPVSCIATDGSSIVGVIDGVACDLSTGKPLHPQGDAPVVSVAWGQFGLIVVTSDGSICRIHNQKLVPLGAITDPTAQVLPVASEQPSLWLAGGVADELRMQQIGGPPGAVYAMPGITAMASMHNQLLIATGRRVDRASATDDPARWSHQPAVILPDNDQDPIIGVADIGGRLYFSTADSVFTVEGNVVLPVVDGIGGRLFPYRAGLLIHDSATGRVMALSPAPTSTSAEARP
jgi:hypothetical protein